MAGKAAAQSDWDSAERLYRALFADADLKMRSEARFRLAMLQVSRGKRSEAALLLRRLLDDEPAAQRARLEYAALLATMGDEGAAWRELRALATRPLPADAARVVERMASALDARRPFGGTVSFGIAPDSNINRATRADTLGTVIGDFRLNEDGRVRSGVGLTLGAEGFGRIGLTDRLSLVGRAVSANRFYRDNSFNDVSVGLVGELEYQRPSTRLGATLGTSRRWYGGKRLNEITQVGISGEQSLTPTLQLRLSAAHAWIDNRFNPLEDGRQLTGAIGADKAASPVLGFGATVTGSRRRAADPGYAYRAIDLSAYGWRDLGRVTISVGGGLGKLEADQRLLLFPRKREDRSWRLSVGATFRQLQLFGFAPAVTLVQERNASTIEIYDYRRRAAEFSLRRAF